MPHKYARQHFSLRARLLACALALILAACTLDAAPATLQDTLTVFPGRVNPQYRDSIRILRQQSVAEGLALLYRWQTPAARRDGTFCIATTFVTPEGSGWRAQSSGYFAANASVAPACDFSDTSGFKASYYRGGGTLPLTTVFGLSSRGARARIAWSDGYSSVVSMENNVLLEARIGLLDVKRVDLLDASDHMIDSKTFVP